GNQLHALRSFNRGRPANQNDASTSTQSSFGQRVSHFSRGANGEVSHRVKIFARGASRNQDTVAFQIMADSKRFEHGLRNRLNSGEPAFSRHSAGKIAFIRRNDPHAASAQNFNVFLGGRVIPHVHVHGGSDDHGS